MKINTLLLSLVLSALALPVFAQNASTPNLDKRQVKQEKRIENGVKSGQLTASETAKLESKEAKLEADKQAAKADGTVTRAERRRLQREANRDSRAIHRKKHNANTTASPASAK